MEHKDYTSAFLVEQTPMEAFGAINNVTGWWTENVTGSTRSLGDEFKVTFGTTWKMFRITDFVPGRQVAWLVTDCCMPWNGNTTEWTGTTVRFGITEQDGKTQVRFTHVGLVPEVECYGACSNAWSGYVQSLRNLIAAGAGKPALKK